MSTPPFATQAVIASPGDRGDPLISIVNLVKIYQMADLEVVALQGLDLEVPPGEMLAILGTSGSGKSTLLNILGGLDAPTAGKCAVAGYNLARMNDVQRTKYRRKVVGHIWQQSGRNLLAALSIVENVTAPLLLDGVSAAWRQQRARDLLGLVGLGDKLDRTPRQLSGGEQQRAAIAMALANEPVILLADEPTGELDSRTAQQVMALLRSINRTLQMTMLIVTHDAAVAATCDRAVAIHDGRTSTETRVGTSASVDQREAIVIDQVGRLQLPKAMTEAIPFNGRAYAVHGGDHVELWPLETPATPSAAPKGISDDA